MVTVKNILVTGSNGQLGSSIKSISASFKYYNFFFKDKSKLDITNFTKVNDFLVNNKIDIVINCAAFTNVDDSEINHKIAYLINHLAVENLAKLCSKNKVQLIHISTDYVFDGEKKNLYTELDIPKPKNNYGKSKLKGENSILEQELINSAIIRTSWLYSEFSKNFVTKIINKLNTNKIITVVEDEYGSPTCANDLAHVILNIIPKLDNSKTEIYHYSNSGICSRYEFAKYISELLTKNIEIKPISKDKKDIRPIFSALNSQKIKSVYNIEVNHWKFSLRNFINNKLIKNEIQI
tara:strand:- start:1865 stop:2746 length:882 start_codon:yes stop_codon:yes gene_type:complete